MRRRERERFDEMLDALIDALPARVTDLLEEAPLIVEDSPSPALLRELGLDPDVDLLCGLHSGTSLTERSFAEGAGGLETIHLFRQDIVSQAGGWAAGDDAVRHEIRITLLHEIGHHFGLEEQDLLDLGYG